MVTDMRPSWEPDHTIVIPLNRPVPMKDYDLPRNVLWKHLSLSESGNEAILEIWTSDGD